MSKARSASDNTAPTRVLVTGSVRWRDRVVIEQALDDIAESRPIELLTGMAAGADEIARAWAVSSGVSLRAEPLGNGAYPAPMHAYNETMLSWQPHVVLAFKHDFDPNWSNESCVAGTEHMCRIANEEGVPVQLNNRQWLSASGDLRHRASDPVYHHVGQAE